MTTIDGTTFSTIDTPTEASQTRYVYFYVPAHSDDDSEPDASRPPGAFLRLGNYSDLEQTASTCQNDMTGFYPAQHISDEGGDNLTKAAGAAGANARGIALACDGRILIKSAEKIYIHANEQVHIHSNDNIKLVADSGAIDNTTGDKFTVKSRKKISMRSGVGTNDNYTKPSENTSGDRGIEVIADEGKSNIFIEGKSLYLKVNGTSTSDITENNSTIMRADNFEDIWGDNFTIFRGTNVGFYFGVGFTYCQRVLKHLHGARYRH